MKKMEKVGLTLDMRKLFERGREHSRKKIRKQQGRKARGRIKKRRRKIGSTFCSIIKKQ